jgi:hypothetical protein
LSSSEERAEHKWRELDEPIEDEDKKVKGYNKSVGLGDLRVVFNGPSPHAKKEELRWALNARTCARHLTRVRFTAGPAH